MDEAIEEVSRNCTTCAINQNNPAAAPIHPWETPNAPWLRIHMDFAGPYHGKMFLIVVDAYSKWLEVAMMAEATSRATVNKLRQIFSTHGLPQVSVSDNGPAFIGDELKSFMKRNGIKQVYSAPYHPASNGQAERMVRTFKESLATMKQGDLQIKLDRLLYKYRITPHSTTGKTPAELMFNREIRTPFHLLQPGSMLTPSVPLHQDQKKSKTREFREGELVWARNFGEGEKWISGIIKKRLGNVTYEVKFEGKPASNRHVDHLKKREKKDVSEAEGLIIEQDFDIDNPVTGEANEVKEQVSTPLIPAICTSLSDPLITSDSGLRRSSRTVQKPAWTSDFVTK